MTFYNPSDSEFTRHYREEVAIVSSAIDCVLHREHVIYCSSELTSGLRLYNALREHKLKTSAELKSQMGEAWCRSNLWDSNVQAATEFAEFVRHKFSDRTIVITPGPFSAPDWNQEQYLAFWETLLRTRIKSAWFNRNWQFSNGCVFEFAVTQDAGLPAFDQDGKVLDRSTGIELIHSAIQHLEAERFDASMLRENLERLDIMQASSRNA